MKIATKRMDNNSSPKATYKKEISITAMAEKEANTKAEALSILARNLTTENLQLLASKSNKQGINDKIQKFKHFI